MDVFAAVVTLFLIMDPLGNILLFLSVLKSVAPERRRIVLIREILLAYGVLLVFLFVGRYILSFFGLEQETISIAGGIVLFLIALRMIFPGEGGMFGETTGRRALLVPLAIPFLAGPSTLAALLLLERSARRDIRVAPDRADDRLGDERRHPARVHVFLSHPAGARAGCRWSA